MNKRWEFVESEAKWNLYFTPFYDEYIVATLSIDCDTNVFVYDNWIYDKFDTLLDEEDTLKSAKRYIEKDIYYYYEHEYEYYKKLKELFSEGEDYD